MTDAYAGPPCLACGVAHKPHLSCRREDIVAFDEARRAAKKGKTIKVLPRPKYEPQVKVLKTQAERAAKDARRAKDAKK